MTNVTNASKAPVALRDEADNIITIPPGAVRDVPGFNTKDRFNASLIKERRIIVGGAEGGAKEDAKAAALQQKLDDAKNDVKLAKEAKVTADEALAKDPENGKLKAEAGRAAGGVKNAEAKLEKAQDAFDRG